MGEFGGHEIDELKRLATDKLLDSGTKRTVNDAVKMVRAVAGYGAEIEGDGVDGEELGKDSGTFCGWSEVEVVTAIWADASDGDPEPMAGGGNEVEDLVGRAMCVPCGVSLLEADQFPGADFCRAIDLMEVGDQAGFLEEAFVGYPKSGHVVFE